MNRRQVASGAVGTLAGGLSGLALFGVSQLGGAALFALVGALAGAVAMLLLRPYIGRARLTSLTISVPRVSELTFVIDDAARQMAWRLYIEAATRVSTQPTSDGAGNLREALTSLYGLFVTTRDALKAGRPSAPAGTGGHSVEYLAITMLNRELRPFLSRWHPRLREFEQRNPDASEAEWPLNRTCWAELDKVRGNIVEYALGFGRLAEVRDAESMFAGPHRALDPEEPSASALPAPAAPDTAGEPEAGTGSPGPG